LNDTCSCHAIADKMAQLTNTAGNGYFTARVHNPEYDPDV